jgi:hypothetical protein
LARGQAGAYASEDFREERITEDASGRFGNDDTDRVDSASDEASRDTIGHVAELGNGPLDRLPGFDPD